MSVLGIANQGPLIVASDLWQSALADQGSFIFGLTLTPFAYWSRKASGRPSLRRAEEPNTSSSPCWPRKNGSRASIASNGWLRMPVMRPGHAISHRACLTALPLERAQANDGRELSGNLKIGRPGKCLEPVAYFQIVPQLPWLRRSGC